ncbi:MAG: metalloregulator ArsR/SmtB family transcription factor [Eubacteriales bacterium]|nr:metalloregulator ArsR/SmtB family transcription factor [Eubacteriales bacterium]
MQHIYRTQPESFIELAEILKAIAHPQRLCIVKTLCEKDHLNVGDMQHCLGEAQATVSQHLIRLKAAKIITGKREGTNIYYSIIDERARNLVKAVINEYFSDEE